MKRALVLLTLAAGTLAGCATTRLGAEGTLRADLFGDRDGPRVSLSEPAYVAVFQVGATHGGARLVYPEPGAEQVRLRSGTQSLAAVNRAWNLASRYSADVVLYLVASREPLDLSGFEESRDARTALGAAVVRRDPYQVLNALATAVVADPEAGWTDDTLQPGAAPATRNRSLRRIDHCGLQGVRVYRTPQSCVTR